MLGKFAVLFALSAAVVTAGMFKDSPERSASRSAAWVLAGAFESAKQPDAVARLRDALAEYDRRPTVECAQSVEDAFAALDVHLADLRKRAGKSAGGLRAELEIRRIELERERDLHLQRFHQASRRVSIGAPAGMRGSNVHIASSPQSGRVTN